MNSICEYIQNAMHGEIHAILTRWQRRTSFSQAGPVLDAKTGPAGPNYVNQNWSGRIEFCPGPILALQSSSKIVLNKHITSG